MVVSTGNALRGSCVRRLKLSLAALAADAAAMMPVQAFTTHIPPDRCDAHMMGCRCAKIVCGRTRDECAESGKSARGGPLGMPVAGLALLVALLAGCAVGPDFVRPAAPTLSAYTPATVAPILTAGEGEPSQHLAIREDIPAAWWRLFHSSALDEVVRQALAGSPTLEAAKATLAQAQQTVLEARGGYYPQVDFAALAERQKGPAFALGLLPAKQGLPDLQSLLARSDGEFLA